MGSDEIFLMLKEKYDVDEVIARKVSSMIEGSSIKELLELADLVDDKKSF